MTSDAAPRTTGAETKLAKPRPKTATARAFWVRQFINWHWISAAISLVGMFLFAATGITLNHAGDIATTPVVREATAQLPAPLLQSLEAVDPDATRQPLPNELSMWVDQAFSINTANREAEWSDEEIYLAMSRPGGDSWISIDRTSGEALHEDTWRGWIAYLNDLHKGRNTGEAWAWFIDIFALACVIFCITGLGLLWFKAAPRPATWPLVGLGMLIPMLLALFLIH